MNQRLILHIDFDSFFASVEQQANPAFRGKPLGVTATNGRNCIIASSREAKKLGIGTGSRVYDAKRICPDINLIPAGFSNYWEISKKFIAICKDFSPLVEVFSIDELFMDVTLTAHLFGGVTPMIKKIKERIRLEIGEYITVSIGISHNKLLAKLGSGMKKPNGEFFISEAQVASVYRVAKLTDICGIGSRIEVRLQMMGIYTLTQLHKTPLAALIAEFGQVEGAFLNDVGWGRDRRDVVPYTDAVTVKSVSRNYCLPHNEYDKRIVLQNIYELCEEIGIKLRRLNKRAKTGGVYLRGEHSIGGHLSHGYYFSSGAELFTLCIAILENFILRENEMNREVVNGDSSRLNSNNNLFVQSPGYVRQLSVWVGNLKDENELTLPLLEAEQRKEKLIRITDSINNRFGDHTIRNGFLLYAQKLTTVPNGYMADRYERNILPNDPEVKLKPEPLVRKAYRGSV